VSARRLVLATLLLASTPALAVNPAVKMNGVQLTPLTTDTIASGGAGLTADSSSLPRWDDGVTRKFLPFSASLGTAGQCLISGGASAAATWGTCGGGGGSGTLAASYAAGASASDSTLSLDATRGKLTIKDNATPIGGLVDIQASNGTSKFLFDASNLTFGINRGIATTAGIGAFDFSNATGVFKTSLGTNTFGGLATFGSGIITKRTAVANANYTVLASDYEIVYTSITAPRTVTLPSAQPSGAVYIVKDESGSVTPVNYVAIQVASGNIDGVIGTAGTVRLWNPRQSITFVSDGSSYHTIGGFPSAPSRVRAPVGAVPTATVAANQAVYVLPVWVPSDVTRLDAVCFANRYHAGSAVGAVASFSAAICTSNGAGACSGAMTTILSSVTIPGDGNFKCSTGQNITRGSDGKILLSYNIPANGTTVATQPNVIYGQVAAATATVNPLPGGLAQNSSQIYQIYVDYHSAKRKLTILGDSIAAGYATASTAGWENSWPIKLGRDKDWAVSDFGAPAATAFNWSDDDTYPNFIDTAAIRGADVVLALGTNDLSAGLDVIKSHLSILYRKVMARGANRVYGITVPPCAAFSASNATRVSVNNWQRLIPFDLVYVIDFDAALDPSATNSLPAGNDSGDGCHPNTTGQGVMETAFINAAQ
jgi:hypothetical protein